VNPSFRTGLRPPSPNACAIVPLQLQAADANWGWGWESALSGNPPPAKSRLPCAGGTFCRTVMEVLGQPGLGAFTPPELSTTKLGATHGRKQKPHRTQKRRTARGLLFLLAAWSCCLGVCFCFRPDVYQKEVVGDLMETATRSQRRGLQRGTFPIDPTPRGFAPSAKRKTTLTENLLASAAAAALGVRNHFEAGARNEGAGRRSDGHRLYRKLGRVRLDDAIRELLNTWHQFTPAPI